MTYKNILFAFLLAPSVALPSMAAPETAKGTIAAFYEVYLSSNTKNRYALRMTLPFSKSFRALIDGNATVCKEKAGTDICGWQADIDPYLSSQDGDDHLTYKKAIQEVREVQPGHIRVYVRNFPDSAPTDVTQVDYLMIQENGRWVVNDMIHANESDRKNIQDEINSYLKPTP